MAGSVLSTARKLHPQDPRLRRCAIDAARRVTNHGEWARLLREEAIATRTPRAWGELFSMLVTSEANDAAREVLDQHRAELTGAEGRWRDVLRLMRRLDLTPDGAMLERFKNEGGWEATLAAYEFLAESGAPEKAEEVLWDLFRPAVEQHPLAASTIEEGNRRPATPYVNAMEGANWSYRRSMANSVSATSYGPQFQRSPTFWPPRAATLQDARDWALLQLANSVNGTDRAAAFPQKLAEMIKDFPVSERIFAWSTVENIEHLLGEIDAYVAGGAGDAKLNGFCGGSLQTISRLAQLDPALVRKAKELMEKCPPQVYRPESTPIGTALSEMRSALSRNDFALAVEKVEQAIEKSPEERDALVTQFLSSASRGGPQYPGVPPRPGSARPEEVIAAMVRAGSLGGRPARRLNHPPSDSALWWHEAPRNPYGMPFPTQIVASRQKVRTRPVFPPDRLMQSNTVGALWGAFAGTPNAGGWPALKAKLDSVRARATGESLFFVRVASAYLSWWHDDTDGAVKEMRELLAETNDDEVRIGLASMLVQKGQWPAADELLGKVALPYPAFQRIVDTWRLRLAANGKDVEKAAALAKALADAPLSSSQLGEVARLLAKIGRSEEASVFRERLLATLSPMVFHDDAGTALQEMRNGGRTAEAVALARSVLAAPQGLVMPPGFLDGERMQAIQTLEETGNLDAYIATIEQKARADHASLHDLLRFAEAVQDPEKMDAAWRLVLARDPRNPRALREVATRTRSDGEPAIESLEMQPAGDPLGTLSQRLDQVIAAYAKAKQLPRLADQILRAPFPRPRFATDYGLLFRLEETCCATGRGR